MSKAETWLGYLPSYYHDIREMKAIADAEGPELDKLTQELDVKSSRIILSRNRYLGANPV